LFNPGHEAKEDSDKEAKTEMTEILKQSFAPLSTGSIRIIFCSKNGNRISLNVESDEPLGLGIKELFNKYSIYSKVGGMKSAERRKSGRRK
jgi:two-component sensor histidine kinase